MTTPIEKACFFIISKAFPSYNKSTCGHCARAVRTAWDFATGKHIGQVLDAKDYGPSYEKIGFKNIFSHPQSNIRDYKPQIGDICIIQSVKEGEKILHPDGHICMLTSKGWISDFVQTNGGSKLPLAEMYGGSIRDKNPDFDIYRYVPAN